MRITGGTLRGRRLAAPKGRRVRPTSDRVKEALFSIIGPLSGEAVLDVCAGAGSLGLEALSRGAASVVFVEKDREARRVLEANMVALDLQSRCTVVSGAAPKALDGLRQRSSPFDLIFLDPPYASDVGERVAEAVAQGGLLAPDGLLILEHDSRRPLETPAGLTRVDGRTYGGTGLLFLSLGP